MSIQLNHTIVSCRDQQKSAAFLTEILGLPPATRFGHFLVVQADNEVSLDFAETTGPITGQHYAFLVTEVEFDAIFDRLRGRDLPTGPIPAGPSARPSTTATAAAACTSKTRTATCWRSSPVPTAAARRPRSSSASLSRGCQAAQAARRRTSQTVAAMSSTDSASSQPPSIAWKGQNRLPDW